MSNMSYCRFRNTEQDLRDCLEYIHEKLRDERNYDSEKQARQRLIELCQRVIEECNVDEATGKITVEEYEDENEEDA